MTLVVDVWSLWQSFAAVAGTTHFVCNTASFKHEPILIQDIMCDITANVALSLRVLEQADGKKKPYKLVNMHEIKFCRKGRGTSPDNWLWDASNTLQSAKKPTFGSNRT